MDYTKNSISTLAIFSLLLAGFIYVSTLSPFPYKAFSSFKINPTNSSPGKNELEEALQKASMEDNTVIITVINKAYVEPYNGEYPSMFDLFLESFWEGEITRVLLEHLLVVAVDETAYERCKFRRLHCYRLVTGDVDFAGEKVYMSVEFINMMWRRTRFLMDVLKLGYNFIFTDTDVMWLRNPFLMLNKSNKLDLQMSTDWFNGNPFSNSNSINTGFYHVRSNSKTITLFQLWYAMRRNSKGMKEQDVLNKLIHEGVNKELGLRIKFLDNLQFSGFCSDNKDVKLVMTVHANCCRSIEAKVTDLKNVLMDWKRFKEGHVANGENSFKWSNHTSCTNSWHVLNSTLS
ncbi:putative cytochromeA1-like [Capsicum annuum]|uniref:Glycosyltransferase n=1 Tax=Capsicum annuum TaxID=4072 RepID=A0A1U8EB17_CAPAN|nr:uncharacterized protein At1g28695 [Capsicum annuum]KAF3620841.1 putative cytochromeA1-like [Capsicum annuum]KAF3680241.1 putative cytochromeA1-like [Capsicum annuum]PHT95310.1 hypothetical protein T459_03192 [Capsicum annuum]